jgi:nucleoside 2-deoxyribosyltransferase
MRDFLVYLAGPIAGLTYDQGQDWRDYVAKELPREIRAVSPLRAKAERLTRTGIITDSYEDNPLTSQRGLTARDRMDCTRSDALIMNLLGAQRVTIGTMIEIGWADAHRIPIILVIEKSGNLHDHPMVRECASFRVETLDDAVTVCEAILLPEGKGTAREIELDQSEALFRDNMREPWDKVA